MKLINKIFLAPFALLYGLVIAVRNWLYNNSYLRSITFDVPVINVGNLSTGGTGKTPHVDYLIQLLKPHYPIGVLSRGYRRKTTGYLEVQPQNKAIEVGDEPLLTKWKHPEISVAVSESRAYGIPSLVRNQPENFVVLLDDAFQHRSIRAGLNILLTPFHDLYVDNEILPLGNLREFKNGAKRADIIIVSHSPNNLGNVEKKSVISKLNPEHYQFVFFSSVKYLPMYSVFQKVPEKITLDPSADILLLTGIASNQKMYSYLESKFNNVYEREFADHHHYEMQDIESIITTFNDLKAPNKYIVTTEKDLTRLHPFAEVFIKANITLLCLPIKIIFAPDEKEKFEKAVHFFVNKTLEEYQVD